MKRRKVLAGAGSALITTMGGCIGKISFGSCRDDKTDRYESWEDYPRIDTPPQDIESQDEDTDPDSWNEENLGECMATEPTVAFDQRTEGPALASDVGVAPRVEQGKGGLGWVTLIETADAGDEIFAQHLVDQPGWYAVDFADSVLVVIQTGPPTTAEVTLQWARVEPVETGVHIHGYHTTHSPHAGPTGASLQTSVLEMERHTEEMRVARVSLTISEMKRVHFDSTEGIVNFD